jgi:hypothetical protein
MVWYSDFGRNILASLIPRPARRPNIIFRS